MVRLSFTWLLASALLLKEQAAAFSPTTSVPTRRTLSFSSTPSLRSTFCSGFRQHFRLFDVKDGTTNPQTDDNMSYSSATATQTRAEAQDALSNVGWSLPTEGDLTSDDPFVQAINAGIQRDVGVPLDELLNPAKVVNLERDLYNLRLKLAELTGKSASLNGLADATAASTSMTDLSTADCDGGGGGEQADAVRASIAKKETDLAMERRAVFRGWLKNVFLVQAILSFGLSFVMATNPQSLFGGFDWFYSNNMDVSIQVLGYWWWWLFVIPSLRSRRPKGFEKKALDMAFVASPVISLLAPVATKDTGVIWAANLVIVAASYAFAYASQNEEEDDNDSDGATSKQQPEWLKFVYKSLDFGSGRERGARN